MASVTVRNAVDTFVNAGVATKNYNTKARLLMQAAGGAAQKRALMYFNRPFPIPTNVYTGKLRLYTQTAWSGSITVTVKLLSGKWNINRVNWNNQPGTGGGSATLTQTGSGVAGQLYEVDVTTLLQTIASAGQSWYGFQITVSSTTDLAVHSAQSPVGAYRPALAISWGDAPDEPDQLKPAGGRVVNSALPVLSWSFSDIAGDQNLQAVQVQLGSSQATLDAGTATWDSGTVPSSEPQMDTSLFAQPATLNGTFETDVSGWSGNSTTLARTTAAGTFRSGAAAMSSTSASTAQPLVESAKFPVVPGMVVAAQGYVKSAVTVRTWQARINWYDANQAAISSSTIVGANSTTTTWTALLVSATAPANAAYYSVMFNASATIATEVHYIDDVTLAWGNSAVGFPSLGSGSFTWWRVRNQDGAGLWSPWADSVQYGNLTPMTVSNFQLNGAAAAIHEASPTATWTTGVRTQRAYQIFIAPATDPNNPIWDSGKITSSQAYHNIPFGVLVDASISYNFTLRLWDIENREAIPGVPVYIEAYLKGITFDYSGAVTNPTGLSATSDAILPKVTLNFSAATPPDQFQIQRSDDNGTTWYYLAEAVPSEWFVSGTAYQYVDNAVKQYIQHQWKVMRIVGGVQGTGAVVSGVAARLCPVLMRTDGSDACFFMNPERDRQRLGIQGLVERMGGPPVLVTQRIGGQAGHVKGQFVDEAPGTTAYTAVKQRANFLRLEQDSGQKMVLAVANETLTVVAFNFNIDVLTDVQGVTYMAEFDWIEVGS